MKKILPVISNIIPSSRAQSRDLMNRFLHFGRNDIIIVLMLFFGSSSPAHAQSVSLSISPPVVEILLAPNQSVSQTFTLQTQGENILVTPELHLAHPSDSSGHVEIDSTPLSPSSIPLTIKFSGPSHTPTLTFTAANTDKAQDVYLALVFRASPPSTIYDLRSTITTPSISALILVTITPTDTLPINLEIKDFSPPLFHDSWFPLTFTPFLTNNTPTMIRPEGQYEIISPSGKTVLSLPLYPNLILGNSSRLLQGTVPCQPLQGTVPCNPTPLTWSPTWRNLGPHTLRLTITTTGGTQIIQVEKTIWILPVRIAIITVLFILLFIIFLVTRGKSLSPPLDRLSQKTYS